MACVKFNLVAKRTLQFNPDQLLIYQHNVNVNLYNTDLFFSFQQKRNLYSNESCGCCFEK